MGSIFGKPKHPPSTKVTEHDKAVLGLKLQRDKMRQAYRRYEKNLLKEKEMAKELLKQGRKDRALLMLKRKRYQESIMDRIAKQMDNIDSMVSELETAQLNKDVLEKLKQGNEALQLINQTFSIEDAEKIMDDTREAAEYQEEMSKILAGQLSSVDIAEVEEELEAMARETAQILPDVPSHDLPEAEKVAAKKEKQKQRERVALEA
uniref:Charged multivesicular body protein 6 n=1 Tax=Panagrolaimus superbus TaxID=310955 RepID=A0A914Z991_9BILA